MCIAQPVTLLIGNEEPQENQILMRIINVIQKQKLLYIMFGSCRLVDLQEKPYKCQVLIQKIFRKNSTHIFVAKMLQSLQVNHFVT